MTYLLLLDDRHLDDLLFTPALGRTMRASKRRVVLVHGSGGQAERLLEANGFFPERRQDVFPKLTAPERALVEAGVRRANRTVVSTLTDALVPAVGFQGGDRGLLKVDASGKVTGGQTRWLDTLVGQGGVPVVSALVAGPEGGVLVSPGEAARALAEAWEGDVTAVVLTRTDAPGLGVPPAPSMAPDALDTHRDALADPDAATRLARAGMPLLVTSAAAFFDSPAPSGTAIVTEKHD